MTADAKEKLMAAANAVSSAVMILKAEMPTIEAFMKESSDMDNFGHIVNPTLWKKAERRATDAVVAPLFKAAVDFVRAHDEQAARNRAVLDRVKA